MRLLFLLFFPFLLSPFILLATNRSCAGVGVPAGSSEQREAEPGRSDQEAAEVGDCL